MADANEDGVLDSQEILGLMDPNFDGGITLEELLDYHHDPLGQNDTSVTAHRCSCVNLDVTTFSDVDANSDGLVTTDEMFSAMDENSDGGLSLDELKSYHRSLNY